MSRRFEAAVRAVQDRYNKSCMRVVEFGSRHSSLALFAVGMILLSGGMNELAEAQSAAKAGEACGRLLGYLEGGFGALIASAAGIGAIIASAVGGFKAAWCLLVVSVGAFILRAYIPLFNAGCQ